MDKFEHDLRSECGMSINEGKKLYHYIENYFGVVFDKGAKEESLYSPVTLLEAIMSYDLWKRKI